VPSDAERSDPSGSRGHGTSGQETYEYLGDAWVLPNFRPLGEQPPVASAQLEQLSNLTVEGVVGFLRGVAPRPSLASSEGTLQADGSGAPPPP
jgi:hypothetical protein